MKLIVPDYYSRFKCLMGNCRHSCCKGWEIDIDDDTLALYKSLPEDTRSWLLAGIREEDGCASFKTGKNLRCPFLRSDGLCEIILKLGMEALSDICFDHPVFRSWYSGRIEQGLGLCCEAAGTLILNNPDKVSLIVIDSDEIDEKLTADEAQMLRFRDSITEIAQDRSISAISRLEKIETLCGGRPVDISALARYMTGLEMMDSSWSNYLNLVGRSPLNNRLPQAFEIPLEQLLVYLIYRHTDDIAFFALPMFRLIYSMLMSVPGCDIVELCRMWSAEIEYSDENPQLISEWVKSHK